MGKSLAFCLTSAVWLSACAPRSAGDWRHIADYEESALFLDASSVRRSGQSVTFWTKLAPANWLERPFKDTEIRTKRQIDCKTMAMRDVEGGIYKGGKLRFPFKKLLSGKVLPGGYAMKLYEKVC